MRAVSRYKCQRSCGLLGIDHHCSTPARPEKQSRRVCNRGLAQQAELRSPTGILRPACRQTRCAHDLCSRPTPHRHEHLCSLPVRTRFLLIMVRCSTAMAASYCDERASICCCQTSRQHA
jgi:hypothetical protein